MTKKQAKIFALIATYNLIENYINSEFNSTHNIPSYYDKVKNANPLTNKEEQYIIMYLEKHMAIIKNKIGRDSLLFSGTDDIRDFVKDNF